MHKLKSVAALAGASGVGLGAFGAHALKAALADHGTASTWDTAVLYHLVHAVAIYAAASATPTPSRAAWAWAVGILLFSGSLYVLALGGPRWLGPITPLGGVAFVAGWLLVLKDGINPSKLSAK